MPRASSDLGANFPDFKYVGSAVVGVLSIAAGILLPLVPIRCFCGTIGCCCVRCFGRLTFGVGSCGDGDEVESFLSCSQHEAQTKIVSQAFNTDRMISTRDAVRTPGGKIAENDEFKSCELPLSNSKTFVTPPNTCVRPKVTEAPRPRESVDLENRPGRAGSISQKFKRVEEAEEEHLKFRGQIQSYTINHGTISYPPKLALKFKIPSKVPAPVTPSEGSLPPGTGVYYTRGRSVTLKGYGKVCNIEALSLLADVSCDVKRGYQLSSKSTSISSAKNAIKDRFIRRPPAKNMASAQKKCSNPSYCKEFYSENRSKKLTVVAKENSYKIVRKRRTPRNTYQPMHYHPTKIQKNISLSMCDEYFSRFGAYSSLADTIHFRDHRAMSGACEMITAATTEYLLPEDKIPVSKLTSNIVQVPLAVPKTTTLVRVSKPLQLCRTNKKPVNGLKRAERFSHQILRFIGTMTVPERYIRQALGNNPDTSKALRLLLTERKVRRLGPGGRGRAYEYAATEKGLQELRELEQDLSEGIGLTPESASRSSVAGATIVSGSLIASDASKSEAKCLTNRGKTDANATAASRNERRPSSVTPPMTPTVEPHRTFRWPVQTMNCTISSESFDLDI